LKNKDEEIKKQIKDISKDIQEKKEKIESKTKMLKEEESKLKTQSKWTKFIQNLANQYYKLEKKTNDNPTPGDITKMLDRYKTTKEN